MSTGNGQGLQSTAHLLATSCWPAVGRAGGSLPLPVMKSRPYAKTASRPTHTGSSPATQPYKLVSSIIMLLEIRVSQHPDRVAAHARLASYLTGASEVVAIFVHTARALTITKRCDAGTSIMQHSKSAASRVICALTASPNKECLRAAWTATNHGYTYPQCHRLPPLPR